jgi:hypothetical protein
VARSVRTVKKLSGRKRGTGHDGHGSEHWGPKIGQPLRSVNLSHESKYTLWLCQNSYWKLPLIVDLPIKNCDFP